MEAHTSTMIATPDREVWFFVKDKKSDNANNVPAFLDLGFLNNLYFAKGFNIEAAGKIENRKICQIFVVTLIIGSQVKGTKRYERENFAMVIYQWDINCPIKWNCKLISPLFPKHDLFQCSYISFWILATWSISQLSFDKVGIPNYRFH